MRNIFLLMAPLLLPLAAAEKHTLLCVFAHPDDEIAVGQLLAVYAKQGTNVWIVTITSGQKGTPPYTKLAGEELGKVREEEESCSARLLGVHQPILLGLQDQGISVFPVMEQVVARLRQIVDEKRPEVILTWGPEGLTGHPDHRAASNLATQVFQQRSLLKHAPRKLYYIAFPERAPSPEGRTFDR